MEKWKDIPGYEGIYEISDQGQVKSLDRTLMRKDGKSLRVSEKILKGFKAADSRGRVYYHVSLNRNGVEESRFRHHLVLEAFVGPRPKGMQACHQDDDTTNNTLANLRWDTPSANAIDIIKNGNNFAKNKTQCKQGHEFTEVTTHIDSRGWRSCQICRDMRSGKLLLA